MLISGKSPIFGLIEGGHVGHHFYVTLGSLTSFVVMLLAGLKFLIM